jgi:hypothetical protein
MRLIIFGPIFWLILLSDAQGQTYLTEKEYEKAWRYSLEMTKLSFSLPDNFSLVKMESCNYGFWKCGHAVPLRFNRVFTDSNRNVLIGIQLSYNYSWTTNSGQKANTNIDWSATAKGLYDYHIDYSKGVETIDPQVLSKNWGVTYGMKYSRKKCDNFSKGLDNNKVVVLADRERQIIIAYLYNEDFNIKIDSLISTTLMMLQKK